LNNSLEKLTTILVFYLIAIKIAHFLAGKAKSKSAKIDFHVGMQLVYCLNQVPTLRSKFLG